MGGGGGEKTLCFCPIPWGCGSRAGGRAERVRQEPSAEPHPSPRGSAAGAGHGLVLPSSSLLSSWHELGRVCLHKLGTSLAFFFFFKLLLLASGRREAFNTGGLEPGSGRSAGWGLEGYWAIRLATAWKGPTPAFLQLGHLPRMGAKCSAPLPRKQTRALLKTPELKRFFFFFFFFLLSSTNAPRWQLMISFPLLQKFKLQGIVTSAGFRSRFHFPVCGSLPSLQAGAGAGVQSADFSSDAAGSLLSSLTVDISAIRISIEICLLLPCIYITYIIYYLCHSLIFYLFIHFKPAKEVE